MSYDFVPLHVERPSRGVGSPPGSSVARSVLPEETCLDGQTLEDIERLAGPDAVEMVQPDPVSTPAPSRVELAQRVAASLRVASSGVAIDLVVDYPRCWAILCRVRGNVMPGGFGFLLDKWSGKLFARPDDALAAVLRPGCTRYSAVVTELRASSVAVTLSVPPWPEPGDDSLFGGQVPYSLLRSEFRSVGVRFDVLMATVPDADGEYRVCRVLSSDEPG